MTALMPQLEIFLTQKEISANLEFILGHTALQLPQVQQTVLAQFPFGSIRSSYPTQAIKLMTPQLLASINARKDQMQPGSGGTLGELNRMFVVSTWALLADTQKYASISTAPIIQFFRHVRNGCAHSGCFNFKSLPHPAKWREKEILLEHAGQLIFPGFITDGDIILLLLDICAKFFVPIVTEGYPP